MKQRHTYQADLSYSFANLTLAAQLQPLWEADEPDHPDIENLFAIPRQYYDSLFIASPIDADTMFANIQGDIQDQYEQIGVIRIGVDIVPDYGDEDQNWTFEEMGSFENISQAMGDYSRRVTETMKNSVRYSFSKLLMGYALRSKTDGHGVIVIRGTSSIGEWLNNMNYLQIAFHPHNPEYGSVHNGFRDIYKGIRGLYRQMVEEIAPNKDLYLIGHSLGGAVTQIAALDIALTYPERADHMQVYTYAAPRTGDPIFVSVYDRVVETSYRIVNVCDVVPYVPFEALGEYMSMEPYPYGVTKGEMAYVHQVGNPIANHVSSYHVAMRDQVPGKMDVSQPRRMR